MHPPLRTIALLTGVATAALTAIIMSTPASAATSPSCDASPVVTTAVVTVAADPTLADRSRALRKLAAGDSRKIAAERGPAVRIPAARAVDRLYLGKLTTLRAVVRRVVTAVPKKQTDDGMTKLETALAKVGVGLGNVKSDLSCTKLVSGGRLNPKAAAYTTFLTDASAALDTAAAADPSTDLTADRALLAGLPDVLTAFNANLSAAVKALAKVNMFDTGAITTAKAVALTAWQGAPQALALDSAITSLVAATGVARPLNWR